MVRSAAGIIPRCGAARAISISLLLPYPQALGARPIQGEPRQIGGGYPQGWQIVGAAEVRDESGGGTASHLQSSPARTGTLPSDFCDGSEIVQNVQDAE